jgi:hypothetical protein
VARLNPHFAPVHELSEQDIAAIVELGRRQAAIMDELLAALKANDTAAVVEAARRICALEQEIRG